MKSNKEKHGDRSHLGSLTDYERGRNLLANQPSSLNPVPFAALTSTRSSLRASRVTLPHSRSRSSPPKMEGRQFHPYHVHRAEPSAFAARSSSNSTFQDGQQSNTVRPLELPQPDDSVVRTIDFLVLGTSCSAIPAASLVQQRTTVENMEIDVCARAADTNTV